MMLDEAVYHRLIDELQQRVEDRLEDTDLDLDIDNANGVLTIQMINGSQIILSRQPTLKQLWLAAKSGGYHLNYDEQQATWLLAATNETINQLLQRVIKEQTGESVIF